MDQYLFSETMAFLESSLSGLQFPISAYSGIIIIRSVDLKYRHFVIMLLLTWATLGSVIRGGE